MAVNSGFYASIGLLLLSAYAQAIGDVGESRDVNSNGWPHAEFPAPRNNGFHNVSGRIYYISDEIKMPWVEAAKYCNLIDMSLISLETQKESEDFTAYLTENNLGTPYFWTSGYLLDGTWFWTGSGQAFTYTNWHPTQPNEEHLPEVALYLNFSETGKWADKTPQSYFSFICE